MRRSPHYQGKGRRIAEDRKLKKLERKVNRSLGIRPESSDVFYGRLAANHERKILAQAGAGIAKDAAGIEAAAKKIAEDRWQAKDTPKKKAAREAWAAKKRKVIIRNARKAARAKAGNNAKAGNKDRKPTADDAMSGLWGFFRGYREAGERIEAEVSRDYWQAFRANLPQAVVSRSPVTSEVNPASWLVSPQNRSQRLSGVISPDSDVTLEEPLAWLILQSVRTGKPVGQLDRFTKGTAWEVVEAVTAVTASEALKLSDSAPDFRVPSYRAVLSPQAVRRLRDKRRNKDARARMLAIRQNRKAA